MKTSTEGLGVLALPNRNVVLDRFGSVVIYMMAALRAQLNPQPPHLEAGWCHNGGHEGNKGGQSCFFLSFSFFFFLLLARDGFRSACWRMKSILSGGGGLWRQRGEAFLQPSPTSYLCHLLSFKPFSPCSLNPRSVLWIACTSVWLVKLGAQYGVRMEMGCIVLFTAGPQGKGDGGWRRLVMKGVCYA